MRISMTYKETIRTFALKNIKQNCDDKLYVLKGIPLSEVDIIDEFIDIKDISKNKLTYFFYLSQTRNIIAYEEFLAIKDFALSQYKEIIIIDNNTYINLYPATATINTTDLSYLLSHFSTYDDDDGNEDEFIGDIDDYIEIYSNICLVNDKIYCSYNDDSLSNIEKITVRKLLEESVDDIPYAASLDNFIDIQEEKDYLHFIENIESYFEKEVIVRFTAFEPNPYLLKQRLAQLCKKFPQLHISFLREQNALRKTKYREEFKKILKYYWGYDKFKNLAIYDIEKLDENTKEILTVSQENIISDIVEQIEKCNKAKIDFRDVFVTAPTGAGKSIMFQIPAIYMAEKFHLLTIVISPLIGLMNDQVKSLETKNYVQAQTINSDISPIVKEEILNKVNNGDVNILYISPETLLSRSSIEQLIGTREIGMIVIDEAHIVTTWGKQFRPDYWYLGDHIYKLRKKQMKEKHQSFVIATFTATAIYHGIENMYQETINSLHMIDPITYLGYIKRDDIQINIKQSENTDNNRNEYELKKIQDIEKLLKRARITNKKTLIYFPTIKLIERTFEYLYNLNLTSHVTKYYGTMNKDDKEESYQKFLNGESIMMLATKAFGMGIDIPDIQIVAHFAPTGTVCDYVQEIGRAARLPDLVGEAYYNYDRRDFKHINRFHGISSIKKYQLVEVIKKIDELYTLNRKRIGKDGFTKKRNALLLDAENFSYIFGTPISDLDSEINSVKTALLLIQKDFENSRGFSPITVRPIPMFSIGFFSIADNIQNKLLKRYPNCIKEINKERKICQLSLNKIWQKDYQNLSFPEFKFLLYSKSILDIDGHVFDFVQKYPMNKALCLTIEFNDDYISQFELIWNCLTTFVHQNIRKGNYESITNMANYLTQKTNISIYKAQSICNVMISSMNIYRNQFSRSTTPLLKEKTQKNTNISYQFQNACDYYFGWVRKVFKRINNETKDSKLYLVDMGTNTINEVNTVLGILESMGILSFEMLGGAGSQIYIYVNQIQALKNIINAPRRYKNKLLESIEDRHLISVKMLMYIFENNFDSETIWNIIENYFLGIIPETVKNQCLAERSEMRFDEY